MTVIFWGTVAAFVGLALQLPLITPQLTRWIGQWLYYWAGIYLSWQLANFIWRLKIVPKSRISPLIGSKKSKDQKRLAVLITGCDTGFGHLLAKKCHSYGFKVSPLPWPYRFFIHRVIFTHQVYAGCLFPDGEGAQNLSKSSKGQINIVKLDVTQDQDVANARKFVEDSLKDNEGNAILWRSWYE